MIRPSVRPDTYRSDAQRYDELLEADGSVRAHWRPLIERLARGPCGNQNAAAGQVVPGSAGIR